MAAVRQDALREADWPVALTTLRDEHLYMRLLLDTLEARIQKGRDMPPSDYFLMHDIMHYMTEYPDTVHHPTENLMFARLVARDPSMSGMVEELQRDHKSLTSSAASVLTQLRIAEKKHSAAAADAVRQSCSQYIDHLRAHMATEETKLFPRAAACLSRRDWQLIGSRLDAIDDPLFGRAVDSRFRVLFEYLSEQADEVSRRVTRLSFLQFDNIIRAADALENGAGELITMVTDEARKFGKETTAIRKQSTESRDVGSVFADQLQLANLIGRTMLTVSSAAAGIYWKTAKQLLGSFMPPK